jgi:peptidoglycan/LPS O-acetylase OafA/YrhL
VIWGINGVIMSQSISRDNNFDLLRLFAALQVFIMHVSTHLEIDIGILKKMLVYFPGVPIFFTISGFLIAMSYDKHRSLKRYVYNRVLRIYPALWVCVIFTIITLLIFKAISFRQLFSKDIILWFLAETSFFQYWTPDILRSWGVGTPNGSLWTIPVEIEFYIAIPIIFSFFKRFSFIIKIFAFFVISHVINMLIAPFYHSEDEPIIVKLILVSIFPHLFNFLLGTLIYCYWEKAKKYMENKAFFWMAAYACYVFLFSFVLKLYNPSYYPNIIGLLFTILLAIMTISLAFTSKGLASKILKGNDISYGVYIFHVPVINIFVHLIKI